METPGTFVNFKLKSSENSPFSTDHIPKLPPSKQNNNQTANQIDIDIEIYL
jgi:hypothetical protein